MNFAYSQDHQPARMTGAQSAPHSIPAASQFSSMEGATQACACGGGCPRCSTSPERLIEAGVQSQGMPLPDGLQAELSKPLQADLSSVRLHTDAAAGMAATLLGARAFTLGSDIVFGPGRYEPGSSQGSQLIRHELAHVAQQRLGGAAASPQATEREAEAFGSGRGHSETARPVVTHAASHAPQCQPITEQEEFENFARTYGNFDDSKPVDKYPNAPKFSEAEAARMAVIFASMGMNDRRKQILENIAKVAGAKFKHGSDEDQKKWDSIGVDVKATRETSPGYSTCGELPPLAIKGLNLINDIGVFSHGVAGVRDGIPHVDKNNKPILDSKKQPITSGGAKALGAWVQNTGTTMRPTPGDIYLLEGLVRTGKKDKQGKDETFYGVRHIGVFLGSSKRDDGKENWQTIDAGQGMGDNQEVNQVDRIYDPVTYSITGPADNGTVVGWVDIDKIPEKPDAGFAAAAEADKLKRFYTDKTWDKVFLECYQLYVSNPAALQKQRPNVYDYLLKKYPKQGTAPASPAASKEETPST